MLKPSTSQACNTQACMSIHGFDLRGYRNCSNASSQCNAGYGCSRFSSGGCTYIRDYPRGGGHYDEVHNTCLPFTKASYRGYRVIYTTRHANCHQYQSEWYPL